MKKILFAIAFVMMMVVGANAQTDGWFASSEGNYSNRDGLALDTNMPPAHGMDIQAPLGSGLLILTAMGAGYAIARRKREE